MLKSHWQLPLQSFGRMEARYSQRQNRLKFESFTAIGELYDAFELVKGENDLNQFIELRVNAVPEKTHSNKIPYKD